MHSALALNEYQPLSEVRSPSNLGRYRSGIALRQLMTAPISGKSEWVTCYIHGTTDTSDDLLVEEMMKAHARLTATQRWQRFVLDRSAPTDVDAIAETVERVFEAISAYGPGFLSLQGLEPEKVQGEHLAAVLRTTSAWRDKVPGWSEALTVAGEALASAGVDPDDALFGMIR